MKSRFSSQSSLQESSLFKKKESSDNRSFLIDQNCTYNTEVGAATYQNNYVVTPNKISQYLNTKKQSAFIELMAANCFHVGENSTIFQYEKFTEKLGKYEEARKLEKSQLNQCEFKVATEFKLSLKELKSLFIDLNYKSPYTNIETKDSEKAEKSKRILKEKFVAMHIFIKNRECDQWDRYVTLNNKRRKIEKDYSEPNIGADRENTDPNNPEKQNKQNQHGLRRLLCCR